MIFLIVMFIALMNSCVLYAVDMIKKNVTISDNKVACSWFNPDPENKLSIVDVIVKGSVLESTITKGVPDRTIYTTIRSLIGCGTRKKLFTVQVVLNPGNEDRQYHNLLIRKKDKNSRTQQYEHVCAMLKIASTVMKNKHDKNIVAQKFDALVHIHEDFLAALYKVSLQRFRRLYCVRPEMRHVVFT